MVRGFRDACSSYGKLNEKRIKRICYRDLSLTTTILNWWKDGWPIDSIVCGSENICFAVLKVVNELNLRIPEDLLVFSFDDCRWFDDLRYPIISLKKPINTIAEKSFTAFMSCLTDTCPDEYQNVLEECSIIDRYALSKNTVSNTLQEVKLDGGES
jgi:DNA-binding LacI/PurR family transcriptional regulator